MTMFSPVGMAVTLLEMTIEPVFSPVRIAEMLLEMIIKPVTEEVHG